METPGSPAQPPSAQLPGRPELSLSASAAVATRPPSEPKLPAVTAASSSLTASLSVPILNSCARIRPTSEALGAVQSTSG
jgi:hypothetical protein